MAAFSFLVVLTGWMLVEKAIMRLSGEEVISSLTIVLTPFLFGLLKISDPLLILKYGIFSCLIYFIAVYDGLTYTIPRFTHYMIGILGLIGIQTGLGAHFLASLFLSLPIILIYGINRSPKKLGTGFGDVLYVISGTFYLGAIPGFYGLMVGLSLFVLWGLFTKNMKIPMPMGPALSIGYLAGILIMI